MPSSHRDRSRSPEKRRRSHSEREHEEERDRRHGRSHRRDREHRDRDRDRDRDREREKRDHRPRERDRERERERDGDREKRTSRDDRDDRRRRDKEKERERERGRDFRSDRESRDSFDRERSPRERRHARAESESSEDLFDLEDLGVERITEEDYFLKASEFRYWLKIERGKYLDELSSADAHKYFRRFVRRWNDGALPRACYATHEARASENTAYKWGFTASSRFNSVELGVVRESVDRATHSKLRPDSDESDEDIGPVPQPASPSPGPQPNVGPSAPNVSERQLAREVQAEAERMERKAERKAERKTVLERAEDLAPRQTGREGRVAEKRAANEQNKQMRDKDAAAGLEVDDSTLMGDDGGFAAALRARDGVSSRRADRRAEQQAELRAAQEERLAERREKESATMDMLKAMARQRFG